MKEIIDTIYTKEKDIEKEKYKYDVIVVMGGGIREKGRGGTKRWRTTSYGEGDDYGSLGARARVIAAEYLYEKGNVAKNILTTTGKPKYLDWDLNAPAESEVMKDELAQRGLPENLIFIDDKSKNTKENIEEIFKIAKEHNWKKLLILSNDYHLLRIREFCKKIQEGMGATDLQIDFESAEGVLKEYDPKWGNFIERAYESPGMFKRIENEKRGLEALKKEKYKSIQEKK